MERRYVYQVDPRSAGARHDALPHRRRRPRLETRQHGRHCSHNLSGVVSSDYLRHQDYPLVRQAMSYKSPAAWACIRLINATLCGYDLIMRCTSSCPFPHNKTRTTEHIAEFSKAERNAFSAVVDLNTQYETKHIDESGQAISGLQRVERSFFPGTSLTTLGSHLCLYEPLSGYREPLPGVHQVMHASTNV